MQNAPEYILSFKVLDKRQPGKVRHPINEVLGTAFLAQLCNADDFQTIEAFGKGYEVLLREYFELPNGVPSHDTFERVFAMFEAKSLEYFQQQFAKLLSRNMNNKIRKILALDGKTQRGNGTTNQKANHIVSAVDEDGFCLGQEKVDDKSNEITAIPILLDNLNIKGHIITTDAMGTQREIVKKIRQRKADYVLALKGNQHLFYDEVKMYFEDAELLKKCDYHRTIEKARGGIEVREYWQTDDVSWFSKKGDWSGLKSFAMTRNTITKNGKTMEETRLFISSLPIDVKEIARAIRKHWMVESYHHILDVTFREDANKTIDKQAAYNLNVFRKLAINTLKMPEFPKKDWSLKTKRYFLSLNPMAYLENIMAV